MSSDKCRYLEDVVKLVDRKPSGRRDAVLMEHAASCSVCGPVLAAAMKTMDDEREGRVAKASGELKAEALDAALVELQKSYPKRKAAWRAGFKPAYAAAAACLLIVFLVIINMSPDPLYSSYSFDIQNLGQFRGGAPARNTKAALQECFSLGYNVERLSYLANFAGKSNSTQDRIYTKFLSEMVALKPDNTTKDVLGLNGMLDNPGNTILPGFGSDVGKFRDSVKLLIEDVNISGGMEFFNLGRAKGALVNLGYAPGPYNPNIFPDITIQNDPSGVSDERFQQLKAVYDEFLASEGKLSRQDAKSLYKQLTKAEKTYFK